ncbi:uncharacterized protein LOC129321182 [Prosopis cineraria]|uniref:uncharacterized protein LOC129321182 n=1 Tax=Prosopis cineraria TaxID=364024 RepID=UPI0024108B49|nr:uncharacterized protein LOC129321182 [Prosopis cineraria]
MYVTRPLSAYLKDQADLSLPPPEGPNSGILVISDEEAESGFGIRRDDRIRNLPFPQNKDLTVFGTDESTNRVMFIPVLNQPLSANRYYVVFTQGWEEGEAATSSKEDDKITCCWGSCIQDATPSGLDPSNVYQQFEIIKKPRDRFEAKSIASDGFPPIFLRGEWRLCNNIPHHHLSQQASGLNSSSRARLPDLDFSSYLDCSEQVVVGKWYCPSMMVKEHGTRSKNKNNKSMFYDMTLEQRWDKVFSKENNNDGNATEKKVVVEVEVAKTEAAQIAGTKDASRSDKDVSKTGFMWFASHHDGNNSKKEEKVGLNMAIVERMKWEQERVGWLTGNHKIGRVEEFGGNNSDTWKKFSCYILVESFVLKTMEGRLVITFDYKHAHQIRCKWD